MKLVLITDMDGRHVLATEQGDLVRYVEQVDLHFTPRRVGATVRLHNLDVEVRPTNEIPRIAPEEIPNP